MIADTAHRRRDIPKDTIKTEAPAEAAPAPVPVVFTGEIVIDIERTEVLTPSEHSQGVQELTLIAQKEADGAAIPPRQQLAIWAQHAQLESSMELQAILSNVIGMIDGTCDKRMGTCTLQYEREPHSDIPGYSSQPIPASSWMDASMSAAERPDVLQIRKAVERHFPLLRAEVLARQTFYTSKKDLRSILVYAENYRNGICDFAATGLRKSEGAYRENQELLRSIESQHQYRQVMARRRQQIMDSLSDAYMQCRVCVIRLYQHLAMEAHGTNPWRSHWPAPHCPKDGTVDDDLFEYFSLMLSMRYTTWAAVCSGRMHVVETHKSELGLHPPPMPKTDFILKKLRPCLAKEKPEGRKLRPGLGNIQVSAICQSLLASVNCSKSRARQLYVNAGAAIAAIYERGSRTKAMCPGYEFNPVKHLSRGTIKAVLRPLVELREMECIVMQPPVQKTSFMGPVAAQKANQPLIFDCQGDQAYSFVKWGPLIEQFDSCPVLERSKTPAFRMGGPHSLAMSTSDIRQILRTVACKVVHNYNDWNYGAHSLRGGRENDWRHTAVGKQSPSLMNKLTGHTSTQGRAPYSRESVLESLQADREAENVRPQAVETAFKFGADRSAEQPAVYMTKNADGSFSAVTKDWNRNAVIDSDEEDDIYEAAMTIEETDAQSELIFNEEYTGSDLDMTADSLMQSHVRQTVGQKRALDVDTGADKPAPRKKSKLKLKLKPASVTEQICGCGCAEFCTRTAAPRGAPRKGMKYCLAAGIWRELSTKKRSVQITTFFRPRVPAGQPAEMDSDL